ncbi:molybdate ABC transporter ATP-binding protein ModF [Klebsiella pneumoniae]|uniref:molybdate ABC transporter ATP-binding protein ModF n=1 Tax=Klebsiella pneumoniae TaxID=573 RepID=UPI0013B47D21|nr:molybdate ABC transporter ATP-binding protein ModF [Klebsiella pneumoniae]QID30066.1 molybdate ABC transporter ATP-binding protein ModF [Klebsiella pneumoniae]
MSSLQISQGTFRLSDTKTLKIDHLSVAAGESWAFVGSNGSGKSALARALAGDLTLLSGQRESHFSRVTRLSFEQLQKLVSDEWQRNNTDLLSPGEEDTGRTTAEIIQDEVKDPARCARLAEQFGISALLDRRFKYLSTGETRKTLLCQALMTDPQLLILDEPFDGLDVNSRQQLAALLAHSEKLDGITLPEPDVPPARHALADSAPRIVLNDGVVSYNDRPVINHLSWTVNPGEHWQIVGPNGAGKSTLLSLVTGDHPQGYSNDLTLFGRRRGSGETIWDIKKHIGYVSSSLHLDYRVSTNVRNVILSGYFDSIGIYQAVSDKQHKLVQQWLDILGIDKRTADAPFHSLSWGQQRLALIVRALVKHPTLLILDEPLQGLDPLNRQLVRRFVDVLIGEGATQLLFVSHHAEDAPDCITHRLAFVPSGDGYTYQLGPVA